MPIEYDELVAYVNELISYGAHSDVSRPPIGCIAIDTDGFTRFGNKRFAKVSMTKEGDWIDFNNCSDQIFCFRLFTRRQELLGRKFTESDHPEMFETLNNLISMEML